MFACYASESWRGLLGIYNLISVASARCPLRQSIKAGGIPSIPDSLIGDSSPKPFRSLNTLAPPETVQVERRFAAEGMLKETAK